MWEGSDIIFPDRVGNFLYTHLENLAQVYHVNYLYIIYIIYICVWDRGEGGHGRMTEYVGHIIHQSTWHTVFGGECWKIRQKWWYSSALILLVLQYKPRFSCAQKMLLVWKHNGCVLLLLCIRAASALPLHCLRIQCETGIKQENSVLIKQENGVPVVHNTMKSPQHNIKMLQHNKISTTQQKQAATQRN